MGPEKKVLVIIPAYNEEASIEKVIRGVQNYFPQADLLVVNDGSTDLTRDRAKSQGVTVLDLPYNLGIGGAMQAGYKYADRKGFEIAIQVDGDGQHDPKEIPKLLDALKKNGVEMIIGSRFIVNSEYQTPMMRRVGISILSWVISMLVGRRIADPTSGFRAATRKAIRLFASHYPQDYPEPEVLVLLSRCGFRAKEVPVEIGQRSSGESSITAARSIYYMVKVLLAIFVDRFKEKPLLEMGG